MPSCFLAAGVCWILSAASVTLPGLSPAGVDQWLSTLNQEFPEFDARLAAVVRAAEGTPYQDGPLGEGPQGTHDTDPLMTLKCVDCVTFVEQSIALVNATSYDNAFEVLQKIRYEGGQIDFEHRNHFMISDWIAHNPWCKDLSATLGVPTEKVTRTISRKDLFERLKAPECGQNTPDRDVTLTYIPSSAAAKAAELLPSGTLIVFIGNVDWLFALHCGIFLRDAQGKGRLFHASSKGAAVMQSDLAAYVAENAKRYRGFTAYKINPPTW